MRRIQFILVFSFFLIFTTPTSAAAMKPANWPWRGIVVNSCCSGVDTENVTTIAGWGANAILLNIRARSLAKMKGANPEKAWDESLEWVDRMLDACLKQGIVGVVRLTQLPLDPTKDFNEKSPQFWAEDGGWQEAVKLAGLLGKRFKSRGAELGAYAVLDEPGMKTLGRTVKPPNWDKVQSMINAAIRKHDPDRYIVVAPAPGGLPVNYRSFHPIDDPAIIYGAHMYVPHAFTHQGIGGRENGISYPGTIRRTYWDSKQLKKALSALKKFQDKHGALVLIDEFSVVRDAPGANHYLSDVIGLFNEFGWGWTYFLYQGNPLWSVGESRSSVDRWADEKLRGKYVAPAGRLELLKKLWQHGLEQAQPH